MRRIILAVVALATLAMTGHAQSNAIAHSSVQQYLAELNLQRHTSWMGASLLMKPTFAAPRLVNGIEMVDAFIEIANKDVIEDLNRRGIVVECEFDGFVTAKIPLSLLNEVSDIAGVTHVEISRLMEFSTDKTLELTRAGQVLDGASFGLPQAYDGTGVVVGIIDAGFDYQHYAFHDPVETSRSRIARVYDTQNASGHPVIINNKTLSGSVFMGEQIDTLTTDCDGTHGTHTASIAAGTHYMGYGGMAPGAEIVLCAARSMSDAISQTEIANCMKYIYAYADSVGKPCVISLSVSLYNGTHDGLDYVARSVEQTVGPGKVFVIAAGNNAGFFESNARYAYGPTTMDKPFNIKFIETHENLAETDYTYYYHSVWAEAWSRSIGTIIPAQFHIVDKKTRKIVWRSRLISMGMNKINASEFSNYFTPIQSIDTTGYMYCEVLYWSQSKKYGVRCGVYNLGCVNYTVDENGVYDSRYQIGLTLYPHRKSNPSNTNMADSCFVDLWVNSGGTGYIGLDTLPVYDEVVGVDTTSLVRIDNFYAVPDDKCTINSIAVNDSVISAGSYVGHTSHYSLTRDSVVLYDYLTLGDIYPNSSYQQEGYGPTGIALPTVCAPGALVLAAGSRYSYFRIFNDYNSTLVMTGPGQNLWGVMTGTSMASPTVAGIIAQWLQIDPTLSPSNVKEIIAQTAIKDEFTHSPNFGPNGKIDAMAGAKLLLGITDDEILAGDVNGDGFLTIKDVTMMIDLLLEGLEGTEVDIAVLDVSQDGEFTIKDVTMLIDILLS